VLQAEVGDGEGAGHSMAGKSVSGVARAEASQGRSSMEASCMCTGEREKRRRSSEREETRGAGEEEQEEGARTKAEPVFLGVSQGSQGKLHGIGESEFSARLANMGLEEECREEVVTEELRPRRGSEPAADAKLATLPLWQRRRTGVQTREALGRHEDRQRDRSSGTDSERQWRLGGGGGGEPWKERSVTEALGIWV